MSPEEFHYFWRVYGMRQRAKDAGMHGQSMPNFSRWELTREEQADANEVYEAARELHAKMTARLPTPT